MGLADLELTTVQESLVLHSSNLWHFAMSNDKFKFQRNLFASKTNKGTLEKIGFGFQNRTTLRRDSD